MFSIERTMKPSYWWLDCLIFIFANWKSIIITQPAREGSELRLLLRRKSALRERFPRLLLSCTEEN